MAQIIFPPEIARQGRGGGGAVLPRGLLRPASDTSLCAGTKKNLLQICKETRGGLLFSPTAYRGGGGGHPGSAAMERVS